MQIGILGSGDVAQTLAAGFIKHGHDVMLGTREPGKLAAFQERHPEVHVGSFADAARFAELAVLAVKGSVATKALALAGMPNLARKPVIDATNPIAEFPPVKGVLRFFTNLDESLMERLQRAAPEVRFVKAFNSVGNACMVDPEFMGGRPSMFICGNDENAKLLVTGILTEFGWDAEDLGAAEAARAIEPLCILWCIPGFLQNDWVHAFKVLRP